MEKKKTKILHIITRLDLGGAQKNVLDIVRFLDKDRYEIYLVSSQKGLLVKEAKSIPGAKIILLSTLIRPINPLADLITLFKLIILLKKENFFLVHTHSSKAGILGRWAARLSGVPIIVHTIHGWNFHDYLNLFNRHLYTFLEKITSRFTDNLIAVSKSDIQKGLSNQIGTKNKYIFIPYGIDKKPFLNCKINAIKKRTELGLGIDASLIGMIACFKPQKSPQDFVQAASLIVNRKPKVKFLLVGDGILRKKIEKMIRILKLKKNFTLLGWRRDIAEIISCLDIVVLTSLWEGQPLVFLEAMYSKRPIVAYDVDGAKELIENGINGFLVKPRDWQSLAERIIFLLENRQKLKRMGLCSYNLIMNKNYHIDSMLKDLDGLYTSLIDKKNSRAKDGYH